MNKIILAAALCVASSSLLAAPQTICGVGNVGGAAGATTLGTAMFTKVSFTPKCSSNTRVAFDESANTASVGAISTKGNQIFSGHSNGGAVTLRPGTSSCGTTAATPCATSDATTAATDALTASSS